MWAMMPMFRVFSSGYCASTTLPSPLLGATQEKRGVEAPAPLFDSRSLPAVVRERLVGLRHLVSVFSLFHGRAAVVGGVEELAGQPLRHAFLRAPARGSDEPPHAQGGAPVGSYFHGHLVRRAAYPPRLDLHRRLAIVHGGLEELEGVLLGPVLHGPHGLVHDPLGRALLAAVHHHVDELRHDPAPVLGIRQDLPSRRPCPTHLRGSAGFRLLRAILRAALLPPRHPRGVERPANDVIADARQILHAAAPDEDDRVLLQVVPHARNVGRDLETVGQTHACNFAQRRVRLLGRGGVHANAHSALLRTGLHGGRLRLLRHRLAALPHQLIDGRHILIQPSPRRLSLPAAAPRRLSSKFYVALISPTPAPAGVNRAKTLTSYPK